MITPPTNDWQAEARREQVLAALGNVWDPEPALDMTLTTPGCPVSGQLPVEAEAMVRAAVPDADVRVLVVWDPPWTPERLSPIALEQLGFAPRR